MARYISKSKAAEYLDVSPATIERWAGPANTRYGGKITAHRIGSRVVFDRDELNIVAARGITITPERISVIRAAKAAGVETSAISVAVGLSIAVVEAVQ